MTPSLSTSIKASGRNSNWPRVGVCSASPRNARGVVGVVGTSSGRQAQLVVSAQKPVAHGLYIGEGIPTLSLKALCKGGDAFVVIGQQPLLGGFVDKGVVQRVAAQLHDFLPRQVELLHRDVELIAHVRVPHTAVVRRQRDRN